MKALLRLKYGSLTGRDPSPLPSPESHMQVAYFVWFKCRPEA